MNNVEISGSVNFVLVYILHAPCCHFDRNFGGKGSANARRVGGENKKED